MSDTSTAVTSAAFDNVTEFHRQGVSIFYTHTLTLTHNAALIHFSSDDNKWSGERDGKKGVEGQNGTKY